MLQNSLTIFSLLLFISVADAQIAVGDSVLYNEGRYKVFADIGSKILPNDADFALRVQSAVVHVSIGRELISWMREGFVHRNKVEESDEDCLLQATFAGVEQAPETTGLVIWRIADTLPLVNISVDEVEKIPSND